MGLAERQVRLEDVIKAKKIIVVKNPRKGNSWDETKIDLKLIHWLMLNLMSISKLNLIKLGFVLNVYTSLQIQKAETAYFSSAAFWLCRVVGLCKLVKPHTMMVSFLFHGIEKWESMPNDVLFIIG